MPSPTCLNRRAFDLELEGLIRSQHPFSLILADIDRFKNFNDEYGHLLGDQVLRAFSKRLRDACKEGVTAYRLGGEEFAMLVPHRSLALARTDGGEHAPALSSGCRFWIANRAAASTTSQRRLAWASSTVRRAQTVLVERTDKLLYKAKELGRNRVMPLPS